MLPELLQLVDKRVLQLIQGREHSIGEALTHMPENLFGWIEFGTVAWQIERMYAHWPVDLGTVMTARTVEHDPDRTRSQLVAQMPQKDLQALAIHAWQQQKDASSHGGLDRRIQPQPLILVLHNPRWTFPHRAPASPQPGDQAKATLIESHHPFECWLPDQGAEVFLKAACCSALAFLCRLRPVFHLTRCFLNSHHSDLPFL